MEIFYKSDFDLILRLLSCTKEACGGNAEDSRELGWPNYDWMAKFYTWDKTKTFIASCIGGVCTNCYNDEGLIHVTFDNHGLGIGKLKVEFTAVLPNGIYPDGSQQIVKVFPFDINLVAGNSCCSCPSKAEIDLLLPFIKGDPFTFDDFTPQQLAEFMRPAIEAAQKANEAIDSFSTSQNKQDERIKKLEENINTLATLRESISTLSNLCNEQQKQIKELQEQLNKLLEGEEVVEDKYIDNYVEQQETLYLKDVKEIEHDYNAEIQALIITSSQNLIESYSPEDGTIALY